MMADAAAATTPGSGRGTTTPGQPPFADDAEMDPYEDDNTWWDGISGWEAAAGWGVEETSGDADGGGGTGGAVDEWDEDHRLFGEEPPPPPARLPKEKGANDKRPRQQQSPLFSAPSEERPSKAPTTPGTPSTTARPASVGGAEAGDPNDSAFWEQFRATPQSVRSRRISTGLASSAQKSSGGLSGSSATAATGSSGFLGLADSITSRRIELDEPSTMPTTTFSQPPPRTSSPRDSGGGGLVERMNQKMAAVPPTPVRRMPVEPIVPARLQPPGPSSAPSSAQAAIFTPARPRFTTGSTAAGATSATGGGRALGGFGNPSLASRLAPRAPDTNDFLMGLEMNSPAAPPPPTPQQPPRRSVLESGAAVPPLRGIAFGGAAFGASSASSMKNQAAPPLPPPRPLHLPPSLPPPASKRLHAPPPRAPLEINKKLPTPIARLPPSFQREAVLSSARDEPPPPAPRAAPAIHAQPSSSIAAAAPSSSGGGGGRAAPGFGPSLLNSAAQRWLSSLEPSPPKDANEKPPNSRKQKDSVEPPGRSMINLFGSATAKQMVQGSRARPGGVQFGLSSDRVI